MTADREKPQKFKFGDTLFALFHLALLVGLIIFAAIDLLRGNVVRFAVVTVALIVYYLLVLHKAVLKEVERRRSEKPTAAGTRPKH